MVINLPAIFALLMTLYDTIWIQSIRNKRIVQVFFCFWHRKWYNFNKGLKKIERIEKKEP